MPVNIKAVSTSISSVLRALLKYTRFRIGLAIVVIMVVMSLASLASPPAYKRWYSYPRDRPPRFSLEAIDLLLGTTTNGRPVIYITINALANSLIIGVVTALIGSHIGLLVGLLSGVSKGYKESATVLLIDSFVSIPGLPLLIVLAMSLKDIITIHTLPLILSVIAWAWPARNVRSITLSIMSREIINLARFSGIRFTGIVLHEVLPYVLGWHLTNFINTIIWAIGMETALAIFGLSILSEDTLGTMIYWALNYNALFRGLWWWMLPPVVVIISIFVGLYLISSSIAMYLNPRLRGYAQ
ncbi:MAG: ABC transporter permease [Ignisphaera sp.]|nr:ABC transporter permease [Ignisphaera sp.]